MIGKILYAFGIEIKKTLPRPMIRFLKYYKGMYGKELIGVEIGTFRGFNAESILKSLDIKKLYLIDPYMEYNEEGNGLNPYSPLNKAMEEMQNKVDKFGYRPIFIKKTSDEALKEIPDNLDFVYIDGDHSYEFVKRDIENYFQKIRFGGIIGGHDFYNGLCPEHDGVVKAVLEFVNKYNLKLYVQYPDWWAIRS